MSDLISRADAVKAIRKCKFDSDMPSDWYRGMECSQDIIEELPSAEAVPLCDDCTRCTVKALNRPSAEAEPMAEKVREALMRLTMCAREECGICKYKDECDFDFQYKISTDNMNTLADALMRSKCEVDAKPADAAQGEWVVTEHCSNEHGFHKWIEIECPFCGEKPVYENLDNMNFCPNCGSIMKGGDDE